MTNLPKLAKIIAIIAIFLLLLQVVVANRLTTAGLTLDSLAGQEQGLRQENELLERKIATFSSITYIAQKAAEAGFAKPQPFYLIPEFPVAGQININASR